MNTNSHTHTRQPRWAAHARACEQLPTQRGLRELQAHVAPACAARAVRAASACWAWPCAGPGVALAVRVARLACWAMAWLRAGPSSGRPRPMLIRTMRFRLNSRFRNSFPIRTIFNISDSGINFRFEQIFNISVSGIIFRFR